MGLLCAILSIVAVIATVAYLVFTAREYGYIFSPFNFSIYIFVLALIISPFFLTSDRSWLALGIDSAEEMKSYLLNSLSVNLFGFSIFIIVGNMVIRKRNNWKPKCRAPHVSVSRKVVQALALATIAAFVVICLIYNNGSFPLINGNRTFFFKRGLVSPLYLIVTYALNVFGFYFGISMVDEKKNAAMFVLLLTCELLTGNRAAAFMTGIVPAFVYAVSKKRGGYNGGRLVSPWSQIVIVAFAAIIFLTGMAYAIIREGNSLAGVNQVVAEVVNGNSFSDIRDGAFLLQGFDRKFSGSFLLGKTYLAGLLSFLPSEVFPFKTKWLWGDFTINTLVDWNRGAHFGFRGGWFLEGYMNFGLFGVALIAIILGVLYAYVDGLYRNVLLMRRNPSFMQISGIYLCLKITNAVICTAETFEMYIAFVVVAACVLLTVLSEKKKAGSLRAMELKNENRN